MKADCDFMWWLEICEGGDGGGDGGIGTWIGGGVILGRGHGHGHGGSGLPTGGGHPPRIGTPPTFPTGPGTDWLTLIFGPANLRLLVIQNIVAVDQNGNVLWDPADIPVPPIVGFIYLGHWGSHPIAPANPCTRTGGAPDPSVYQAKGQAAQANEVKDLYYLFQFRAGGALDAQSSGASPAYANYVFGVYMSAAGYTLEQALAGADIYAQYRSHYPAEVPMDRPNHPFTPMANVINITNGFIAEQRGDLCHQ
jgi:hypothetical protein